MAFLIVLVVAVDKPAVRVPSYYMSSDKFVHAMFNSNRQEEASSKATAAMVLQNAKASVYEARGLRPPTAAVAKNTVEKYWQHMGGKQFPLRTQVSERSHARVQAAHSEMHLLSYFFTVLNTHTHSLSLSLTHTHSPLRNLSSIKKKMPAIT